MPRVLTSKDRVLTAIARQEPDRVPIDYAANPGIDRRLKGHYGLREDDGEGLLQALGVDFRGARAPFTGVNRHEQLRDRQVDAFGIHRRWVEHQTGGYWDLCDFPLRDADEEAVAEWPMPTADDYDYSGIAESCRGHAAHAVVGGGSGLCCIINTAGFLRGMEQVLLDLATDDSAGLLLIDRRLEHDLEVAARTLDAAKGGIDVLKMGEDLGSQFCPLISLELFRKHIRPRHQRLLDLAKAYDVPVMIHTCGYSSWAYQDYSELGVTIVDTLQPEATNMSPEHLKATYGDRLAFHGCISTAGPVATGTVEGVTADVRRTLEIMMPGGGYCLAPTHQLQDNSPTENVVALYEAATKYGQYRTTGRKV